MPDAFIPDLGFRTGPYAPPDLPQRPAIRRPLFTGGLLALLAALFALFPGPESLAFNADAVAGGEVWRLVTGHFVHADLQHLAWNGLALAVLGWLIEREGRVLLLGSLSVGVLSVSALLLSPLGTLAQYCGLSGVLNSLLVVALFVEWRRGTRLPVLLVAAGSVAKLAWELSHGSSLLTEISWPPYPAAHAAGMLGGIFLLLLMVWGRWLVDGFDRGGGAAPTRGSGACGREWNCDSTSRWILAIPFEQAGPAGRR